MLYLCYCFYMFPSVIYLDLWLRSTDYFWSLGHGLKWFLFSSCMWSFLLCDCSSTFLGEWCQFIWNNIIHILSYDHNHSIVSGSILCSLYVYVVFPLIFLHLGTFRSGNVIHRVVYVFIQAIAPIEVLAMALTLGHTLCSLIAHTHFQYTYNFQGTSLPLWIDD